MGVLQVGFGQVARGLGKLGSSVATTAGKLGEKLELASKVENALTAAAEKADRVAERTKAKLEVRNENRFETQAASYSCPVFFISSFSSRGSYALLLNNGFLGRRGLENGDQQNPSPFH